MEPVIIVHGGAAPVTEKRICGKMCGVREAAKEGYKMMTNCCGTALDAVEAAIRKMEDDEYFNAGYGSVINLEGEPEMDASIMDGSDLSGGSAAIVSDVEHPISLARLIKEKSPHVLIAGEGASQFAEKNGMNIVEPSSLVSEWAQYCLNVFKEKGLSDETRELGGTVGCVAFDRDGNVAAGTSTGGTNGKLKGRIGDSPIIGCGTYADSHLGGVSCTGHGESIIRVVMAHTIVSELSTSCTPTEAINRGIQRIKNIKGKDVGAICIDSKGNLGFQFSGEMMPWAYIKNGELHAGLRPGEDQVEKYTNK